MSDQDLVGRTMVITGASSGIGREAAREFAARGATLALVGRDPARTRAIAEELGAQPFLADYDRLDDVRALAEQLLTTFDRIDVLANNAGGLVSTRARTVDGFERTIQSNHLAPALLTKLLTPRLLASTGRVVSTASVANRFGRLRLDDLNRDHAPWLGGWRAYATAKLATILFTGELARRTGLQAYSFHPGFVATGFGADSPLMKLAALASRGQYGIAPIAGAVPLVQLCTIADPGAPSGTYFDTLTAHGATARQAHDTALAAALWVRTEQLLGL